MPPQGGKVKTLEACVSALQDTLRLSRAPLTGKPTNWIDYATMRGLTRWKSEYPQHAWTLSQFLTFPITLARLAPGSCKNVHIIGARADATLPAIFWRELNIMAPRAGGWRCTFVGPELNPGECRSRWVDNPDVSALFLQGLYHEHVFTANPADMFVLFHPGVHHDPSSWVPTISKLRELKKPILLTAFNEADANAERLASPWLPVLTRNPFASQKSRTFAGISGQVVANAYACLVTY